MLLTRVSSLVDTKEGAAVTGGGGGADFGGFEGTGGRSFLGGGGLCSTECSMDFSNWLILSVIGRASISRGRAEPVPPTLLVSNVGSEKNTHELIL